MIDGNPIIAEDDAISTDGDRSEQPLEIDLDHVAGMTRVSRVSAEEKSMRMRRNSDQKQILCKWEVGDLDLQLDRLQLCYAIYPSTSILSGKKKCEIVRELFNFARKWRHL